MNLISWEQWFEVQLSEWVDLSPFPCASPISSVLWVLTKAKTSRAKVFFLFFLPATWHTKKQQTILRLYVCHGPPGLLCVAAISLSVWICSVFVFVSLTRPAGSRIQDLHPPPLTVQVNQLPSVSLLSCCCLKDYSFVISSVQQPWCCFPAERERERQLWISAGRSVSRLRDDLKPSPQWHLLDNLAITLGVNGALALSEYLVTWGLGFSSPFKRLKRSSVMWKPGFQHPVTPVYLLYLFDHVTL